VARVRIRLDSGGIAEVLKSAKVASAVGSLAEGVAAAVRADAAVQRNALPVEVDRYTTDRAAAAVTITHPAGLPVEAKHGSLTRAAAGRGLDVRSRS
jgi:hypothetical protein